MENLPCRGHIIAVDEMLKNLERQVDDIWWENPDQDGVDIDSLQSQIDYYKRLSAAGIVYEPTF